MAKVQIIEDERWPDYLLRDDEPGAIVGLVVDVDAATLRRWRRAVSDYEKAQKEIRALHDAPRLRPSTSAKPAEGK